MKNFRTYELAVSFYHQAKKLPVSGNAQDQLWRAARSIVLNLAEGRGKQTTKEQTRFFYIALGSLRECQAVLTLEGLEDTAAWNSLDKLGAALYCLIKKAR